MRNNIKKRMTTEKGIICELKKYRHLFRSPRDVTSETGDLRKPANSKADSTESAHFFFGGSITVTTNIPSSS